MYYKRKVHRMEYNMKPRVFVSSTFYDLKYIREDLANFIRAHGFEPLMFENGDIGYTPGKALDDSCYETMRTSDMVVLIIGGQYGSPATGERKTEFDEYMSVTRNEFKEAIKSGVPLFSFIDDKVYAEYGVYEANYEKIEVEEEVINFRNTKDINVFRFIHEIKGIGHIVITEFDKATQIKEFLGKQWSDMFKHYLDFLKEEAKNKKIESTVDDMNLLIKKMDIMLESVGKKLLTGDSEKEYAEVKQKQKLTEIIEILCASVTLSASSDSDRKHTIDLFLKALKNAIDKNIIVPDYIYTFEEEESEFYELIKYFMKQGVEVVFLTFSEEELTAVRGLLKRAEDRDLLAQKLAGQLAFSII